MIYRLNNKIMPYAWGTKDFIPDLLGIKPNNKPQAELWLGVHPIAPSNVVVERKEIQLHSIVKKNGYDDLPFLMKVLTAKKPLSIQAHPTKEQALIGYEHENDLKIPLSDPKRNYKDQNHKPELAVALSEFHCMVGFQTIENIIQNLKSICKNTLSESIELLKKKRLKEFYLSLMTNKNKNEILKEALYNAKKINNDMCKWIIQLNKDYPKDIGILSPAYLNVIKLNPGEGVFFPPGTLHSYLKGSIIELMANSDNILRGGLTQKHVEINKLNKILVYEEYKVNIIPATNTYKTIVKEFELSVINNEFNTISSGPEIILCTRGKGKIYSKKEMNITKGNSFFIPPNEKYSIKGDLKIFRTSIPDYSI